MVAVEIMAKVKKKIIFSSYDDMDNPFYGGGGARAIHDIARRLTSEFAVTVITGNYKGAKNRKRDNVVYKRIGLSFVGPKTNQLFFHALLPFHVKKETFDIWIESFTPPFSTSCLQLFTQKPVIGLAHMLAAEDMERKYKLPFRLLENQGLKTYRHFLVLTEEVKKKIETQNNNATFFTIPNAVDAVKRVPKANLQDYILYMGRIEMDQKGLDLLIDAYKGIAAKRDTKLIIAGSGCADELVQLERKIREANLENSIQLVGRVSGKQKDSLFRNCSVVVVPSRFETFGNVALEAMSYGKPLVHFAIDGLQWIPKHASIQVESFNTQALSRKIQKVLNDKELAQRLSIAGQKTAKSYSWEAIMEPFTAMLTRVLEEAPVKFRAARIKMPIFTK